VYTAALAQTLRATAAAYGYTLTIASTAAALVASRGQPDAAELYLFTLGGLAGFAVLELLLLRRGGRSSKQVENAYPFAGALNIVSVCAALGVAVLLADGESHLIVWLLAPLAATATYLVVFAAEIALIAMLRERRAGAR
jgi:uncharacterized membrane protein YbhN (UPF0104 family)